MPWYTFSVFVIIAGFAWLCISKQKSTRTCTDKNKKHFGHKHVDIKITLFSYTLLPHNNDGLRAETSKLDWQWTCTCLPDRLQVDSMQAIIPRIQCSFVSAQRSRVTFDEFFRFTAVRKRPSKLNMSVFLSYPYIITQHI